MASPVEDRTGHHPAGISAPASNSSSAFGRAKRDFWNSETVLILPSGDDRCRKYGGSNGRRCNTDWQCKSGHCSYTAQNDRTGEWYVMQCLGC